MNLNHFQYLNKQAIPGQTLGEDGVIPRRTGQVQASMTNPGSLYYNRQQPRHYQPAERGRENGLRRHKIALTAGTGTNPTGSFSKPCLQTRFV